MKGVILKVNSYEISKVVPCSVSLMSTLQACNQESFRAEEFSWNKSTFIKIHLQHEKEMLRREKSPGFCLETLKNFILKEKLYP